MKTILLLSLIFVLFILQYFCPWWTLTLPTLAAGYLLSNSNGRSFFLGFLMVFGLWLGFYLFLNTVNSDRISKQAAELLFMPNKFLLFTVSSIIAGIVGGLCSLLGYKIKDYRTALKK